MEDLATFARTYAFTDRYISPETRRALYDPRSRDDRIVYAGDITNAGFGTEPGQSNWPYHGGAQKGYRAALIQLPYGYYGAALINSEEKSSGNLASAIITAFYDATRDKPIALSKHGLTVAQYQKYATEFYENGSTIDWMDFYNLGNQIFVNAIFLPAAGEQAYARHDLSGAQYQQEFDQHVKAGRYKLKQVDSYLEAGEIRYAFLMIKGDGSGMPAYHGASAAEHKQKFDTYTSQGFVPVNVSVVSHGGQRSFTAFYEKLKTAGLLVKSTLTSEEYQQFVDGAVKSGMEMRYVNTYSHNGQTNFSAIFYGNIDRFQELRHAMSPAAYQKEFDEWIGKGYSLKMVIGAGTGNKHEYAAVWQK